MKYTLDLENALDNLTGKGGFLTSKSSDGINCMTISWGFIGLFWHKPMFIVAVRPQRYTKFILDKADSFTVSVPYGTMKDELNVCGTKSGTDFDKSEVVKYSDSKNVSSPIVDGCNIYYECKITTVDQLNGNILPDEIKKIFYEDDYHYFYYGEIVECYNN